MAYTKYSLTPANNTATPPDGAPEGMLPSAVNDTMRDMMAQIRDCGDGIRGGTYTMTAPVITGGTINGAAIGGTTAAAGKFTTLEATGVTTVQAGTVSAPAITTSGDTNTGIFFPAADTIAFTEGGAEAMRINSSGNVGIGTNSPGAKVDVVGAVRVTNTSNSANYGQLSDGGGLVITSANNNPMYFNVGGSERMRIDSSGNVMVNTTSASGKFTSAATGSTISAYITAVNNHGLYAEATGTGYGLYGRAYNAGYGGVIGYDSNNTVYGILGVGGYGLSTNASINVNGTIYTSDGRLKENVKPINNALETITKLNPVSFDWKADSAKGVTNKNTPLPDYGMIAQEVEKVLPDIVYETKTPAKPKEAANNKTLEDDLGLYKGVDYSRLIPFLAKAIQEQQAMIEELKQEVAVLKAK